MQINIKKGTCLSVFLSLSLWITRFFSPPLRTICGSCLQKNNQFTAAMNNDLLGTPSLLSRYRPTLMATSCPSGTLVNLNRRPNVSIVGRHLKDDYADTGTDAGIIELYHRFVTVLSEMEILFQLSNRAVRCTQSIYEAIAAITFIVNVLLLFE